ncbi:Uncharacterised protein [uncultured Leptotrichia sp.]|uniref:hypothetical protein n=1 Tax=uncultured Leptotrichia sp. TaxID=159271 RepID=UPI001A3F32A4|nr:hypothetical protein [uncultured Leptotrichia sp.]VTX47337.1 Uncharacterised protein [uncultured Leptotrichia sp.]
MFKEFLGKCLRHENLYILEETGNREKIKRVSKRHGKVTGASILLFDSRTKRTTVNEIYFNSQGYFMVRD